MLLPVALATDVVLDSLDSTRCRYFYCTLLEHKGIRIRQYDTTNILELCLALNRYRTGERYLLSRSKVKCYAAVQQRVGCHPVSYVENVQKIACA